MCRSFKRTVSLLLLVCFTAISLMACSSTGKNTADETTGAASTAAQEVKQDEIIDLELTVFDQWGEAYVPPEEDLVGKAIEANSNYRIKVKEVFFEKQGNWTEEYNLFAAANNFPDVCVFPSSGIDTIGKFSNYFYDLKDYITDPAKTPNMHKFHTDAMISSIHKYKTMDDKYLGWPIDVLTPDFTDTAIQDEYDVLYHNRKSRNDGSVIFAREDILKQLGYSFTPVNDLIAKVDSDNKWLSVSDFKLTPAVDTVAQLEELLYKVKNANLKSKDGKPVVALSGSEVSFNFGGIFAFDFFRKLPDGSIHSYYGSPYAKDFFKIVNTWYRAGLYDKDIYLMKTDQKVQKIANGEAALWTSVGGNEQIQKSLLEKYPEAYIRPIPLPTYKDGISPATEDTQPGPGQSLAINKNFKKLDELIGYLDWLYSDKGRSLRCGVMVKVLSGRRRMARRYSWMIKCTKPALHSRLRNWMHRMERIPDIMVWPIQVHILHSLIKIHGEIRITINIAIPIN